MTLVALHIRSEQDVRFFLFLILEAGLATFIAGYLPYLALSPGDSNRITSIFAQSDVFGGFLLLMFPAALTLFILVSTIWEQFIFGSAAIFLGGALFLTFSRGTWIAASIIILLLLIITIQKKAHFLLRRLLVMGALYLIFLLFLNFLHPAKTSLINQLHSRASSIKNLEDSSVTARFSFWKGAIKMALAHPLLGVGEGNFGKFFPKYQNEFYYYSRFPHNWYLQIAAETGLIALGCFLWFLGSLLWKNWQIIQSDCWRDLRGLRPLPGSSTPIGDLRDFRQEGVVFPYRLAFFLSVLAALLHLMLDVESNFSTYSIALFGELGLIWAFTNKTFYTKEAAFVKYLNNKANIVITSITLIIIAVMAFQITVYWGERFHETARNVADLAAFGEAEENQQINEAQQLITTAGKLLPFYSPILESKGRIALRQFQTTNKITHLETAIKLQEEAIKWDKAQASYYLGLAYLSSLLPDQKTAITKNREALKNGLAVDHVNYPYFYAKLGDLALLEGNLSLGRSYFSEIVTRYPKERLTLLAGFRRRDFIPYVSGAYIGLGKISAAMQDFKAAKQYFETAQQFSGDIEAEGEVQIAHYYLGQLELRDRSYNKALEHFKKALENRFLAVQVKQYLAFALLKTGNIRQAKEEITTVLTYSPTNVDALLIRGDIAKSETKIKEARRYWNQALIYAPGDKVILERIHSSKKVR